MMTLFPKTNVWANSRIECDYPFAIEDHSNAFAPHVGSMDDSAFLFPTYAKFVNCCESTIRCYFPPDSASNAEAVIFTVFESYFTVTILRFRHLRCETLTRCLSSPCL